MEHPGRSITQEALEIADRTGQECLLPDCGTQRRASPSRVRPSNVEQCASRRHALDTSTKQFARLGHNSTAVGTAEVFQGDISCVPDSRLWHHPPISSGQEAYSQPESGNEDHFSSESTLEERQSDQCSHCHTSLATSYPRGTSDSLENYSLYGRVEQAELTVGLIHIAPERCCVRRSWTRDPHSPLPASLDGTARTEVTAMQFLTLEDQSKSDRPGEQNHPLVLSPEVGRDGNPGTGVVTPTRIPPISCHPVVSSSCPPRSRKTTPSSRKTSKLRQRRQCGAAPTTALNQNNASDSYLQLLTAPSGCSEFADVAAIFRKRLHRDYGGCVELLTRASFAIGSPDAFRQLQEALQHARNAPTFACLPHSKDPALLISMLDKLDSNSSLTQILRRYFLVELLQYRIDRERQRPPTKRQSKRKKLRKYDLENIDQILNGAHQDREAAARPRSDFDGSKPRQQRADIWAISELMETLYPDLLPSINGLQESRAKECHAKRQKLKSRLWCARNWYKLKEEFSLGILALVPSGGDFSVSIEQ